MREYASAPGAPTFVLAHGAGAGQDHPWMRRVARGLAERGVRVVTFDFPYRVAKRKLPDPAPVLERAFAETWREAASPGPRFAGGKSMGGRISSQAAAANLFDPTPAGLVFFGYPLHPPGKPDQRRDKHLPAVKAPMLFVHGTRDPFGSPEEMRALVDNLPTARLHLVEEGDHSLVAPKRQDPTGARLEHALDIAAAFMGNGLRM